MSSRLAMTQLFFSQYQTAIYNYIYRLMGSAEDAYDMTQDTFLKAYLALPNVIAAGGTWIATADAIRQQRWEEISGLAAEAVRLSRPTAA